MREPAEDVDGINVALLAALPRNCKKVLEFASADGRLGERYKQQNPSAVWIGIEVDPAARAGATSRLDRVIELDLNTESVTSVGGDFDLVVLGDMLSALSQPDKLLIDLHSICAPNAQLGLCIANMGHVAVIEQVLLGEIISDALGLPNTNHLEVFSPRSVFKLLLNCGWLPKAATGSRQFHANWRFAKLITDAALALGMSPDVVDQNLYMRQLVVTCEQSLDPRATQVPSAPVSVIVPVHDETLASLNIRRSPGLQEIGATVIGLSDATSAAQAFAMALQRTDAEWLLFCNEDVYIPRGSGQVLCAEIGRVPRSEAGDALIGFAGVGLDERSQPFRAGLMLDRLKLCDFPASERAISIADCAVLLHRSCSLPIDPELCWDLWATDLCLQAVRRGRSPRIARMPFFWNALHDDAVKERVLLSAMYITEKYPNLATIESFYWKVSRAGGLTRW